MLTGEEEEEEKTRGGIIEGQIRYFKLMWRALARSTAVAIAKAVNSQSIQRNWMSKIQPDCKPSQYSASPLPPFTYTHKRPSPPCRMLPCRPALPHVHEKRAALHNNNAPVLFPSRAAKSRQKKTQFQEEEKSVASKQDRKRQYMDRRERKHGQVRERSKCANENKDTNHNVPSTSNTIPFNAGVAAAAAQLPSISGSKGANCLFALRDPMAPPAWSFSEGDREDEDMIRGWILDWVLLLLWNLVIIEKGVGVRRWTGWVEWEKEEAFMGLCFICWLFCEGLKGLKEEGNKFNRVVGGEKGGRELLYTRVTSVKYDR
jgi:hypothetical protein